jgi:hypothetical protein
MRWFRTRRPLLHLVIALAFGFMSLGHGPVMTFAKADDLSSHTTQSHSAAHHYAMPAPGDAIQSDADGQAPDEQTSHASCQAFGCFVLMSPACVAAATVIAILLDTLAPQPEDQTVPATPEPTDPPPRPQV